MTSSPFDGSPELGALARRLHRWFGDGAFGREEACAVVLTVARPSAGGLSLEAFLRLSLDSLVRCGVVREDGDALRLTPRAAAFSADEEAREERELSEIGADLDLLLEPFARPEPLPDAGAPRLHEVTRSFLEEVLADAGLPKELVDGVVATYLRRGRLTMSEDGGRYRITLAQEEP